MSGKKHQSKLIKEKALELGFLSCGISKADFLADEKVALKKWIDQGMHGEMGYMERNFDKRLDPRLIVDQAKSVVSVLLNYYPKDTPSDEQAPVLAKYAYGVDYHFVMKDKLFQLLKYIQTEIAECSGRAFVDSAPVLDRAWAVKAGLGWIGKNTNLISVEHGSFFFIGELILDLEIEVDDQIVRNHCGNCSRCIDACPTNALVEPFVLDARKCISYQTIEKKGDLDDSLQGKFKNRVFGCDICQDVCPWNLKSVAHSTPELEPHPDLMKMTRDDWQNLEKEKFNELFRKSAVKRAGFEGIMRNVDFISGESGVPIL